MADPSRPTILVSGASGVVGSALLRDLADHEVIGLVHSGRLADGCGRAEAVRADVSAERLGLDPRAYADLVARTDVIVHSAGLTDFSASVRRHRQINVVGTERMLELASAAGAPIHHISTSWVQAMEPDAPLPLLPGNAIHAYVSSKVTAEQLVRESGVPHSFYRPSNLIGDSQTGKVGASQFIPQLTLETLRGRLPLLPARAGARLDMVPDDVCARAIAACATAGAIGETHWLTYGEASPTIPELVEICAGYARETGRPFTPPAVVDPDRPDEVEAQLARLPVQQRGLFPWLVELSAGITAGGVFPSSLQTLGERYDLPVPDLRDALRRGLEFLVGDQGALAPA